MKKILLAGLVCFVAFAFSNCATKTLYSWHGYEEKSYAYSKKQTPESEQKLLKTYEEIIKEQGGIRKTVPPGVYAEYGYLLVKKGRIEEGIRMLKMEMALYPESNLFVSRIIEQLQNP